VIGHGRLLAEGTIAEVVGNDNGRPDYRLVVDDARSALRILGNKAQATGAPPEGQKGEEIGLAVGPEGPGPIVRELVAGGVEILALIPAQPSLEDLFLTLTEDQP
jgi:hypothetical protein